MSDDAEEKDRVLFKSIRKRKEQYTDVYQGKPLKKCTPIQGVHDVLHAL